MRRFFTLFLIGLLALRALVGDAMAYEMTQALMGSPNQQQVAASDNPPSHAAEMPCHPAASEDGGAEKTACTTCQVCHLSAFLPASLPSLASELPAAQANPVASAWFSADGALVSKPPIL
jgi:hypothetical protein